MYFERDNLVEYVKESFIEFIETIFNTKYDNINYRFSMSYEKPFDGYNTNFRVESKRNGVDFSLDIKSIVEGEIFLELIEWTRVPDTSFKTGVPYSEMKIILDIKMSTFKLLNETDLPKLMIEEYLLG